MEMGSHETVFGPVVLDACPQLCVPHAVVVIFSMSPCQMLLSSPLRACCCVGIYTCYKSKDEGVQCQQLCLQAGLGLLACCSCYVSMPVHDVCLRVCMCYSMGRALLALCPCACMSLAKLCVFAGVTDLRRFGGAIVTLGGIMDWCARSPMVGGLSPELTGPLVTTNQPTNQIEVFSSTCF